MDTLTENTVKYQLEEVIYKPWQFQKGQSGNPAGKPKGTRHLTTRIKEALLSVCDEKRGVTYEDLLVRKILDKAINEGNEQLIKLIWGYVDGSVLKTENSDYTPQIPTISLEHKKILDDYIDQYM